MLFAYRTHRGKQKTSKGTFTSQSTINRELSLLRNAMRTAAHATPPLLSLNSIPRFPISNEDEYARQGFLEDRAFEKLVKELPPYLIPITTVGYQTGIRLGELKKIQWEQVDFGAQLIRLYSGRTKGGKPRTCPFIGNMEDVLLTAKAERDKFWPKCDYVFHRLGQELKDFRGA